MTDVRTTRESVEALIQSGGIVRVTRLTVEAVLVELVLPDAPTNPSATTQSEDEILVSWDDVTDETGYRVERSADGSTGWTDVSGNLAADATSYSDTGLDCSTQYFYRVFAFNAGGDSDPSSTVNDTTDPPATPTSPLATTVSATQIKVDWTDASSTESGFLIERSLDGSTGWASAGTVGAGAETFTDSGLDCETQYFYRVTATCAGGNGSPSTVVDDTTDTCPPSPTPSATRRVIPSAQSRRRMGIR